MTECGGFVEISGHTAVRMLIVFAVANVLNDQS